MYFLCLKEEEGKRNGGESERESKRGSRLTPSKGLNEWKKAKE